ncbi:DUF6471 domain-containing protein [Cupriavidus campinensis]|uniref:DUF6471 domain-containing protein n=1 Tax=Cupriavidus campinensis TaxID=151783 RepID=UPI002468135D|nr:DUF6471 domain-containing protein [Cupriavidus campinensis]
MSHVDTAWTRLASRTARGLLVRKGVSYEQLVECLAAVDLEESVRAVEGKVQRGSFRCSFFFQLLLAVQADLPDELVLSKRQESWEEACARTFLRELEHHGLTYDVLAKRFLKTGLELSAAQLEQQVSSGSFPFTLLLQLSAVAPVTLLQRFVDQSDIEETAKLYVHGG